MAIRKIVKIDEELCDGCGACVPACAEGAIQIIDGKAKLVSDVFCDGLGACLGECPQGAITIEEREADDFDERAAAEKTKQERGPEIPAAPALACGCPGSAVKTIARGSPAPGPFRSAPETGRRSALTNWPVQIKLVPVGAPFLKGADLLICADCVPFSVPDFHERYLNGRVLLVGCPKLDDLDFYRQKLEKIFASCAPSKITVLRMEVPCCGGITHATVEARNRAGLDLPVEIHTIGIEGGAQVVVSPAPAATRTKASG